MQVIENGSGKGLFASEPRHSNPAMLPPASQRLLLVDGHAYAYRAFHAIRQLSSPSGAPTNAIYGFIKMLGKMRAQLNPTHIAVVWDGGLCSERTTEHPEYKTNRPAMPGDLEVQISALSDYLEASGVTSLCRDGVEADDWIADLALAFSAQFSVVIASADKDFMQLVSDRIGMLNPNDKSEKIWGPADVRAKTGVEPSQIVDWLALLGDSVDNIPGVPGVGPKTAAELLERFGSIEGIYSRLGEVKSDRLRTNLEASTDLVQRNKRLVSLKRNMEPVAPEDLLPRAPQNARLAELYSQWGFKTLLSQLNETSASQGALL